MTKDLVWWKEFLPNYNGVSIAWMKQELIPDNVVTTDASKSGIGGYLVNKEFFHVQVPCVWSGLNIVYSKMWAVIIALRVWGAVLTVCRIVLWSDNMGVVDVLTYGCSRDLFLQAGMREVCYLQAVHQFEIRVRYITSKRNFMSDSLSRWRCREARLAFRSFAREKSLKKS